MRGDVLREAFGRLGAAEERWIFVLFLVIAAAVTVAAYRHMRGKMR